MRGSVLALLVCSACVLSAADFRDFQAARGVIGQSSFSGRDKGVVARALSLSQGNLYVADASGHVLAFDLSIVGAAKTSGCPVCLVTPQSIIAQNVFQGVAAVAVHGRDVVIADAKGHRVMIWNGVSPTRQPDVVLSGLGDPVSVAIDDQHLFVGDASSHHVFIWKGLPSSGSQPPDVTLGVVGGSPESPGADTIQTPTALVSDGANLFVADSASQRVLIFSPADAPIPRLVNAASLLAGPLAPGTLAAINQAAGTTTTVFLNGNPIPVTETSGDQLQIQIPYELNNSTAGSLWIKTELDNGSASFSTPVALRFSSASPGIFAFGAVEPRTGLLLHAPAGVPLSPEDPAKPLELLTVWATGLGAVVPEANLDGAFPTVAPVRATINGNPIEVISAVLPAQATGIYEVRLRLPSQLAPNATLVLSQNESKSNAVTFPVESNQK